jgi:hypothetical protein
MLLATAVLLLSGFDTNITLRDFNGRQQIDFPSCHIWRFDALAVHASCDPMALAPLTGVLRPGSPIERVVTFDGSVFYLRTDCRLITSEPVVFDCFSDAVFKDGFE